eukprot:764432-Hanusia_phi.AAC.2
MSMSHMQALVLGYLKKHGDDYRSPKWNGLSWQTRINYINALVNSKGDPFPPGMLRGKNAMTKVDEIKRYWTVVFEPHTEHLDVLFTDEQRNLIFEAIEEAKSATETSVV